MVFEPVEEARADPKGVKLQSPSFPPSQIPAPPDLHGKNSQMQQGNDQVPEKGGSLSPRPQKVCMQQVWEQVEVLSVFLSERLSPCSSQCLGVLGEKFSP